jgi:hypothetical protein
MPEPNEVEITKVVLDRLVRGCTKAQSPEEERILAELAANGLARREGDGYVFVSVR